MKELMALALLHIDFSVPPLSDSVSVKTFLFIVVVVFIGCMSSECTPLHSFSSAATHVNGTAFHRSNTLAGRTAA